MSNIFPHHFAGDGAFAEIAAFMTTVGRMLDNIHFWGGRVVVTEKRIDFYAGESTGTTAFSGTAYVAGNTVTGLNSDPTKPWVRCNANGTATEDYGPAPNPFPANEEWYPKATTPGDIHAFIR